MSIDQKLHKSIEPAEQELFDFLNDVVKSKNLDCTLRVVGGWCRDKMLGQNNDDVDIMIDTMSGLDFARQIPGASVAVVEENPDRSKHLETAIATIVLPSGSKFKVDFVKCRKETYTDGSRIPSVEEATPQEDAFRRDLTINSMFYNIQNNEVEDFTGKGKEDIEQGVCRAPGNPMVRFHEDPLRVFRTIRFASRFGFEIEPNTWDAMKDPEIQEQVLRAKQDIVDKAGNQKNVYKLARERIGTEFLKMVSGPDPVMALSLLKESGLLKGMMDEAIKETDHEGNMADFDMDQNSSYHQKNVWDHTIGVVGEAARAFPEQGRRRAVGVLTAFFHDWGKLNKNFQQERDDGKTSYKGHEEASSELAKLFMGNFHVDEKYDSPYAEDGEENVKKSSLSDLVSDLAGLHMRPYDLYNAKDSSLNKLLLTLKEKDLEWEQLIEQVRSDIGGKNDDKSVLSEDFENLNHLEERFRENIRKNKEAETNMFTPILNGHEIMAIFNNKVGGEWIGEVSNWLREKQLDGLSDKSEAIEMATRQFPQYIKSPIENVTAATGSLVYRNKLSKKIHDSLKESPVTAVSLAARYFDEHKESDGSYDHERSLELYLRTATQASISAGESLISVDLMQAATKFSRSRMYNPELTALTACAKLIKDNELDMNDMIYLALAHGMNPKIVEDHLGRTLVDEDLPKIISQINEIKPSLKK